MKYLGLMHYYPGLEVWQELGEVFLGKRKYVIEILHKFCVMDYKSMATSMVTILKKLRGSISNLVDPSVFQYLIDSLMHFLNTRMEIGFAINMWTQFYVELGHEH